MISPYLGEDQSRFLVHLFFSFTCAFSCSSHRVKFDFTTFTCLYNLCQGNLVYPCNYVQWMWWIKKNYKMSQWYFEYFLSIQSYHKERIVVACRPRRHPDYPRSHHTQYHRSHSYTLQLCPLLAHPWWSNSLGKCSDSDSRLCHHQPAASSYPQCT